MAQRTLAFQTFDFRSFHFRPPAWRAPAALHAQTGALCIGSLVWLACYGWLAMRLLQAGLSQVGWIELGLALVCIALGAPLALGWHTLIRRWRARLRRTAWPALSLEQLVALTPAEFEDYVAQRLFVRQGYQVQNTPDVKDGGVDILVTDAHGRRAVVQCKRYRGTVGEAVVRDLYGTMIHHGALMAYLVTTGSVSEAARRWAAGKPIGLIDGVKLLELAQAEPALH
ncbi:MAG TPA: restriction endonuclease [Caldilineaceae bacterium]|nr:restriction endonuclease [Caldilineaceae bacterium]